MQYTHAWSRAEGFSRCRRAGPLPAAAVFQESRAGGAWPSLALRASSIMRGNDINNNNNNWGAAACTKTWHAKNHANMTGLSGPLPGGAVPELA